jgi:murein DD-endopeptidase MepM/ murein hydrolase activator NlpD
VYAGSGIRQYGNMLIIKHNKDYLTVYAHNSKLLARDGQTISTGQTIAEMGSHGGKPLLHFELRYRGKPIDPSAYFQ